MAFAATPRRIGILGAGAMGTLFGARLASAGVPVTLVDVNDTVLDTLRRAGARCTTDEGLLCAPVEALRADQLQTGPALWLVFTKSAHTRAALQSIAHRIGPDTHFLSLQNGIGHAEVLQEFAAINRIAVGVTTWPARLLGPGEVSSLGQGSIRFMPCNGQASAVFTQLVADLNQAGLNSRIDPQVKGVLHPADARRALDKGVDGLIVSNHGGRQLDAAPSAITALPAVLDAVGEHMPVLVDGGFRRGSDVVKALALGARGVLLGRAPVYGLASAGEEGVSAVLSLLRQEVERSMVLLGAASIGDLGHHHLMAAGPSHHEIF